MYTWLVYNRDDNLCIIKSEQKLTDWARSPRAEIFKILHSVDILVFKNTKCQLESSKYDTKSGDINLIKLQMAEEWRLAMILCLHAIRVWDTCTKKVWELSGYITPRTHYSRFLDGSLLYMPWDKSSFLRVYVPVKNYPKIQMPRGMLKLWFDWYMTAITKSCNGKQYYFYMILYYC